LEQIPKINAFYWAIIISANTMGKTAGDLISQPFNLGYGGGTVASLILFLIVLTISVFSKNQKPLLYSTVIKVASTSVTTVSDFLSRTLSVAY
jgi:uncharacterized membrane-anchored protein